MSNCCDFANRSQVIQLSNVRLLVHTHYVPAMPRKFQNAVIKIFNCSM